MLISILVYCSFSIFKNQQMRDITFLFFSSFYNMKTTKEWNLYFEGYSINYENYNNNKRISYSSGNFNIFECNFKSLSSTIHGGAISLSVPSSSNALIEVCSFENCKSSQNGGAIYMDDGNCVTKRNIGNKCSISGSWGAFAEIDLTSSTSKKNFMLDSSISECFTTTTSSTTSIYDFYYGIVICECNNISLNTCSQRSIYVYPTSSFADGLGSIITYCTISNNTLTSKTCIYFVSAYQNVVKSSNIIGNKQPISAQNGIVDSNCNVNFKYCYFLENYGSFTFSTTKTFSFIN